jgi:hypothetical protein
VAYAVVHDVPASWADYLPLAAELRRARPRGLICHVAGPTDEGYRTIEVWESRRAFEAFVRTAGPDEVVTPGGLAAPTLRELEAPSAIH